MFRHHYSSNSYLFKVSLGIRNLTTHKAEIPTTTPSYSMWGFLLLQVNQYGDLGVIFEFGDEF